MNVLKKYLITNFNIIALAFVVFILSCNSTGIESQNITILKYADLPSEVKKVMFEKDYIQIDGKIYIKPNPELNDISKYEFISKQHWLMPWVYEGEIERKSDKKRFKLDFSTEHGSKCVIQNDFLYVPRHYNIYMKDSLKYSFSRIKLD